MNRSAFKRSWLPTLFKIQKFSTDIFSLLTRIQPHFQNSYSVRSESGYGAVMETKLLKPWLASKLVNSARNATPPGPYAAEDKIF